MMPKHSGQMISVDADSPRAAARQSASRPGAPPSLGKCTVRLRRGMRIDKAVRRILLAALADIRANRPGVIEDIDTEFLHQFRIAVRRTRSVLGLLNDGLPKEFRDRYYEEFTWVHEATGVLRDLDVLSLERGDLLRLVELELQAGLGTFFDHLVSRRAQEFETVRRRLSSRRLHMMLRSWETALSGNGLKNGKRGRRSVRGVARRVIAKRFRAALKMGREFGVDSPDEDLHRLRIRFKKLRYLMQFLAVAFPKKKLRRMVRLLARLQDCLGEFNDRCVQLEVLEKYRSEHADEWEKPAIDSLISSLDARKASARASFHKNFDRLAKHEKDFLKSCNS
jgi:CHAD domain-containing protein